MGVIVCSVSNSLHRALHACLLAGRRWTDNSCLRQVCSAVGNHLSHRMIKADVGGLLAVGTEQAALKR